MPQTRVTKVMDGYVRGVVSEDGINYRHERQDMEPIIKHVDFLSEKVNGAPKRGNRNGMHYIGTIPQVVLIDWCKKVGIGIDVFARNNHEEKANFLSYLKAEFPVLFAKKKKSSQIVVPQ